MTAKTKVADQDERDQIINNIKENIFVEAGAGSGKTASLVKRMVSMVKSGIDVSKITAITFTKTAAVEFYNRFEEELANQINSNIPEKEKELCKKALLNIDLCFLGTIDAFCNMVLSENPIEAGIPLNSSVVEDDEYNFLISEEYNNILRNIKDEDKPYFNAFSRFQNNSKDAFNICMLQLLSKRNYGMDVKDLKDIEKEEKDFYNKYEQEVKSLANGIMKDKLSGIHLGEAGSRNAKQYLIDNEYIINDDWKERPGAVINFINKGLKPLHIVQDFIYKSAAFDEYFEIPDNGKFYKATPKFDEILKEYRTIQYDYTLAFVLRCVNLVSSSLIKKGKLSFFDNLLLFRDLLKNDAKNGGELIKHINKKHEYYLVDEFQDTDPLQAEIIFYLTAEKPNEDFTLCKPKKGSLFIVGDPKQSIYRFRNADVVSYNKVKELFKKNGDSVVTLTSNFRTHKELIDYFNIGFDPLFNTYNDKHQARFDTINYVSDNPNRKPAFVSGNFVYETTYYEDPLNVSKIIRNLHELGYDYGDFMVLTQAKEKLIDYMDQFDDDSIPYEVIGQSAFNRCEPLHYIELLLGAFAYPENSYYSYMALKEIFKLSDDHIHSVFKDEKINLFKTYNDPSIDKLIKFYQTYRNEDIVYMIDKMLEEFDIIRKSNINHLEYLYYAKDLLRNSIDNGNTLTIKDAYIFLNDLANKKGIEKCISLSNDFDNKRVLLANVHKVKGLERRIVILTCNKKNAATDPESKVSIHTSYDDKKCYVVKIGIKTEDYRDIVYAVTDEYNDKKTEEGKALFFESDRIAYVAATRACDALFVASSSVTCTKKDPTLKNVLPWGNLIIDPALRSNFADGNVYKNVQDVQDKTDVNSNTLYNDVISFDDKKYKDSTFAIVSPSKLTNIIDNEEHKSSKVLSNDATLKGTVIHRLMELLVLCDFKDDLDMYIKSLNDEFNLDGKYDQVIISVYNTINNGGFKQENGFDSDIISILKGADEIYPELPFAYKENTNIYNGIIDLLYKKDNKWVIVDYKTNYDDKELDTKYENQLEAYKKALKTQGIDADAYIYHIEAI